MTLHVGITATRQGLTIAQEKTLLAELTRLFERAYGVVTFHHGDCIGGDATSHDLAMEIGYRVTVHPPDDPKLRAFKQGHVILPERPYLIRNHDIVDATSILLGCPESHEEKLRSGTWATIRYARKNHHQVTVIQPNGDLGVGLVGIFGSSP